MYIERTTFNLLEYKINFIFKFIKIISDNRMLRLAAVLGYADFAVK